jgi:hypothetical protein
MTKKKDTAAKPNRKTSQRIPIPRLSSKDMERINAAFERWCTVRDQRVGETSVEDLRWALEQMLEFANPSAPPASLEEREGMFVRHCARALHRVQSPHRENESETEHDERRQKCAQRQATVLIDYLEALEPKCQKISPRRVAELLTGARANRSAAGLAFEVKTLGRVWPQATTVGALRKAEQETRQPES